MFKLRSILAAPLVLAFAALPAAAQYYPAPPPRYMGPEFRVIPEPEIVRVLHSLGFTPIARPRLQGRLWIVRALDEEQMPMRVVVDASTGEIIDAIAIGPGGPPIRPQYGMVPGDPYEPEYPLPPAAQPYPRQNGPQVIYRDRGGYYGDELPPPPATIGPRSNLDRPANQARRDLPQEKRAAVPPAEVGKRAVVPTPKPKPSELAASPKDPVVTGSVPPKAQTQPLPPVNPLE